MSLNTRNIMYRLEYHAIILTIRGKKSDKISQNIKKYINYFLIQLWFTKIHQRYMIKKYIQIKKISKEVFTFFFIMHCLYLMSLLCQQY